MVVDFPTDAVAGARRTPGRLKTGGVPPKPPATIFPSLCPSVFWDFGSLFRTLRRHFLTRCRGSRLIRPRRCGGFGLVSRHKPAEHHFLMFPPRNCQCTRSSCRVEAKSTEKFSRSCASSVFPVRFNVISANCCGSGRPFLDVAASQEPAVAAAAHRRCSVIPHHRRRVLEPSPLRDGERRTIGSIGEARRFCLQVTHCEDGATCCSVKFLSAGGGPPGKASGCSQH